MVVNINKDVSNAFKIATLIATILVVSIHYNTKHFINVYQGVTTNYLIQEYLTNGLARIAVPYFAMAAGFFFFLNFKGIGNYLPSLYKRVFTLVIPYILVSIIIFVSESSYSAWFKGGVIDLSFGAITRDILLSPLSVQFWFLRDLIFLSFLSPIIWASIKRFGISPIIFLSLVWINDLEYFPVLSGWYLVSIETLFFFSLGCYLSMRLDLFEKLLHHCSLRITVVFLAIYLALLIVRVYLDPFYSDGYTNQYSIDQLYMQNISIFLGVFLLIKLASFVNSTYLFYMSSFSFFVFLFHAYPLNRFIVKFSDLFIMDEYKFYFTFPLAVFLSYWLAVAFKHNAPKIYKVVSGGRGSDKS